MNHSVFARRVLATVSRIPRGKTLSYKDVACKAGSPRAYRAVGAVLSKNCDPSIPCHRVIRSDGKTGLYNKGARVKKDMLRREGVRV